MAKHEHSRYAAGAISATTLGHLLGEASGARAQGVMTWTSNKPLDVRGRADVVTGVSDVAGTYLQMQYNTPRPWYIRLLYRGADVPIRRVCVHGHGHGFGRATHMHTYRPDDGEEICVLVPDTFHVCPISPSISNEIRRTMFFAFAELCRVDTSGLAWVDPPDAKEDRSI